MTSESCPICGEECDADELDPRSHFDYDESDPSAGEEHPSGDGRYWDGKEWVRDDVTNLMAGYTWRRVEGAREVPTNGT